MPDRIREPIDVSDAPRVRSWAVRTVGFLLLGQAIWFTVLAAMHPLAQHVSVDPSPPPFIVWLVANFYVAEAAETALWAYFAFLALLTVLATLGFFRVQRSAWGMAMFVQTLNLLTALALYFTFKPAFVYVMMIYGVIMVLYLSYSEIETAFRIRPRSWGRAR